MLAIDHVIIVVEDLDAAAQRLYEQHGLASVPGGRHAGHGTGNCIVPLGPSYIELMAVVDRHEAASSPLGAWVERRVVEAGETPAALCLRTNDVHAVAQRTGCPPLAMSRTRPDGVKLEWQLVALDAALTEGLPFFIQWQVDDADHPGQAVVEHRVAAAGIEWVEIGGDEDRIASWLGPHVLPLHHVDGAPGPYRVAIAVAGGEAIVLG